jgi:hypothetical protein
MKTNSIGLRMLIALSFLFLPHMPYGTTAMAKVDCSPVSNTSNDLPRTAAIASNLPGLGVELNEDAVK